MIKLLGIIEEGKVKKYSSIEVKPIDMKWDINSGVGYGTLGLWLSQGLQFLANNLNVLKIIKNKYN